MGCLFWFEKICWRMQQGRQAVERNLGGQHLKREASQKSQELCLRKADWSPWCQAMRLDRWAEFKKKKKRKKLISNPEIMLRPLESRVEPCPYVLQGMHNLTFSFWEGTTKLQGNACPGGWAAATLCCPSLAFAVSLLWQRGESSPSATASLSSQPLHGLAGQEPASHKGGCCGGPQHAAWAWDKQNQN